MIFIDWFLPGFKAGGPIRSIAHLTEQLPFRFSIVTSIYDHHSSEPYPGITANTWHKHASNVRVMYLTPSNCSTKHYTKVMSECMPDKICINSLFSPSFALKPLIAAKRNKLLSHVVLAPRGMLKSGALKVKRLKKSVFLFLSRSLGLFDGILWHATNAQEKKEIIQYFGAKSEVRIAANLAAGPQELLHLSPRYDTLKLCTVARVSEEKNLLGGLQLLIESRVKSEWHIYGVIQNQAYAKELVALAEGTGQSSLFLHGEINPNQLDEALKTGHFFFLPTLGENYGHSIVEALMRGLPVIISNKTPWVNLKKHGCGWDLSLDSTDWKRTFERAMSMDNEEYKAMRTSAHVYGNGISQDEEAKQAYMAIFGN